MRNGSCGRGVFSVGMGGCKGIFGCGGGVCTRVHPFLACRHVGDAGLGVCRVLSFPMSQDKPHTEGDEHSGVWFGDWGWWGSLGIDSTGASGS